MTDETKPSTAEYRKAAQKVDQTMQAATQAATVVAEKRRALDEAQQAFAEASQAEADAKDAARRAVAELMELGRRSGIEPEIGADEPSGDQEGRAPAEAPDPEDSEQVPASTG